MSRADYVAQKIREATAHPNATLLFSIGAACPSPQRAASMAHALGLTNKEEQLAKWVAIMKRDAEKLFGKPFLEALRNFLREGGNQMEVKRGQGFFAFKATPLLKVFAREFFETGIPVRIVCNGKIIDLREMPHFDANVNIFSWVRYKTDNTRLGNVKYVLRIHYDAYDMHPPHTSTDIENISIIPTTHFLLAGDDGLSDLQVRIGMIEDKDVRRKVVKVAKRFGLAWEAKSKQLKESREAKVTIYKDFA